MYTKEICKIESSNEPGLQAGDTVFFMTVAEADQTFEMFLWIKKVGGF